MNGPSGTWTTTSGGAGVRVTAGGVLAVAAVAVVAANRHAAASAVNTVAVAAACLIGGVVVIAVAVLAVVRVRGHRAADEPAGVSSALELRPVWKQNPNAIPAAGPKAIASPLIVANTYNFYGEAGMAMAERLMADQRQVIPGTAQEVQR